MNKKYLQLILEDKYKKLANLQCDQAVFETLEEDVYLGDTLNPETGEKEKLQLATAKEHIARQISEVERAIEVNLKLIKDAKKTK